MKPPHKDSLGSKLLIGESGIGDLAHAGAMYFGYYMAIGAFIPFINLYYERLGLSGVQIGTLAALPVLVTSSAPLLLGSIADAFHWHRGILRMALLLTPIAVFMLSQATHYAAFIPFVIAYALFSSPIIPLLDSAALEVAEANQRTYGDLRVWGTIGWSLSTWLVGTLIERFDIRWFFYSYISFMALTLLTSLFQPARSQVLRSSMGHGLRRMLFRRGFLIFLFSIFLLAVTTGAVNSFFSLYLDGIGAGEGSIGLAWTLAALSEVPVMIYSGAIMRRISAKGLLKIAFLTYALRWLFFSFITTPTWALLVQLMHGLSFAAFLVGGVTYINSWTPEGLGTTAQSIFNTLSFGLASIVGSLLGGYFYDIVGLMAMFRILSLMAVVGSIIFWLADKLQPDEGDNLWQA